MTRHFDRPGWLVVNADDFGVSRGSTLGVVKAHREGIVTSTSLAVTTPNYRFAVESARACPDLGIGLHFTLTAGRPASDPRHVPLLVNADGYFRWRFLSLLLAANRKASHDLRHQIETELHAQFDRLGRDGIRPDHVNSERHVHLIPGIFDLVLSAAQRYGVPYVRVGRDIGTRFLSVRDVGALTIGGAAVKWAVLSGLSGLARDRMNGVSSAEHFASYLYTGLTGTFLPMLLSSAPLPGVTEIMVHPALPDRDRELSLGNRHLERYVTSPERRRELDACIAARGRTGAWQLTNFRQLAAQRSA